jgi:hypothetical protein
VFQPFLHTEEKERLQYACGLGLFPFEQGIPMNDFSKLQSTEHMLRWLAAEPYVSICSEVEHILQQQVPGSRLISFHVTSDPHWLTGARPSDEHRNKAILVRSGVAFEFDLTVGEPTGQTHELQGVFSWVGVHLDNPEKIDQRIWFDLNATLETHGSNGELKVRMYFDLL